MKLAFYLGGYDSPTGKLGNSNGLSMLVIKRILRRLLNSSTCIQFDAFLLTQACCQSKELINIIIQ